METIEFLPIDLHWFRTTVKIIENSSFACTDNASHELGLIAIFSAINGSVLFT